MPQVSFDVPGSIVATLPLHASATPKPTKSAAPVRRFRVRRGAIAISAW
jgi:hypothetical protein